MRPSEICLELSDLVDLNFHSDCPVPNPIYKRIAVLELLKCGFKATFVER